MAVRHPARGQCNVVLLTTLMPHCINAEPTSETPSSEQFP